MIHNLDHATHIITKVHIGPKSINISQETIDSYSLIMRRLYRIFSHSFFHHNQIFIEFEVLLLFLEIIEALLKIHIFLFEI